MRTPTYAEIMAQLARAQSDDELQQLRLRLSLYYRHRPPADTTRQRMSDMCQALIDDATTL